MPTVYTQIVLRFVSIVSRNTIFELFPGFGDLCSTTSSESRELVAEMDEIADSSNVDAEYRAASKF